LLVIVVVVMFVRDYFISQMVIGGDVVDNEELLFEKCQRSFISIESLDADLNQVNITLNSGEVDKMGIMVNSVVGDYIDIHYLNPGDFENVIVDDFDEGDEIIVFSVMGEDFVCGSIDSKIA